MLAFSFLYFYQEFYLYKCPDDACIKPIKRVFLRNVEP